MLFDSEISESSESSSSNILTILAPKFLIDFGASPLSSKVEVKT